MAEHLKAIALTTLDKYDLRDVAEDLTSAVRTTNTSELLDRRHLTGVIARHTDDSDSLRAVMRAKNYAKKGRLAVSAILDAERDRFVGMATAMPGLPLRMPTNALAGLLPAKLTRRSDRLSEELFMDGPNITAWLDAHYNDPVDLGALYAELAEQGGKGSWTIEPVRTEPFITKALALGGLQAAQVAPMRYDDNESGFTPPLSQIYTYQPDLGEQNTTEF